MERCVASPLVIALSAAGCPQFGKILLLPLSLLGFLAYSLKTARIDLPDRTQQATLQRCPKFDSFKILRFLRSVIC
jgi:hypothetical protein